ncbi:diaminopimelate decarboxylase [Ethanoligenens harbinense]|uniref:Diaminopimelate decarboxylase n=1 Tax=Ethanoligenens harbinense (strain DSM 18485 / JCM 12961 / CGMCC 1.5033 / YUAN-3) TaxID=663278 RepID=E6U8N8_ETHHY|nr:diaminopimelate decarboxylase [Ethanoligenens harbinense]ADU26029.1 diaminopimelate decarboxylase [Ethanoligenens harbinense YUAN-3]AVQ95174.1 diaminopimelate decarboxylase [Ethanoligenens harbinense YUAN-3]AYF37864.1 diaminopimelate decarboxylase [Ethanoligenens harbinense]AYF40588.1 diaminopimelate decarboxylase [Ethanoligenens harbinense]QCN91421.1 diaminopimelate decarboxylase [Ethanoligenens harbinense]
MFVSDCLNVNLRGHLTIGGCDTLELAEQFGTPLYVMDEATITQNCRKYVESIGTYYNSRGRVYYASKAFCCKEICRIMENAGMGLDVVSGGELYTAMSVGFPADRICFHGNNKTPGEINYALDCGVGRFVVDNLTELALLNTLALARNKKPSVLFRIKPGIDAHTHNFIRTGQIDSKFGLALETGEAEEAVRQAVALPGVSLTGMHCHIGSQIFDIAPFELAAEVMVNFMADMRDRHGADLTELNLGGGFGIQYVPGQNPVPYDRYMQAVSETVKKTCEARDMETPFIMLEPGRSIVASAGITLYTVGAVKDIPGVRTYVSVDGGMGDNPRYALYQAEYAAVVAGKAAEKPTETVTIAGKCCESGDLIQEHTAIQPVQAGDILAVFATGAYNYSMASNYNRIPRPATVMIRDRQPRVIIRRESFEDLVRNDV